jgi:hypothetical protein
VPSLSLVVVDWGTARGPVEAETETLMILVSVSATVFLKWPGCLTTTCHRAVSSLAHVCTASGGCAVCAQICARTPTPSSQGGTAHAALRCRESASWPVVQTQYSFSFLFSFFFFLGLFCKLQSEAFDEGVGEFEARKWGLKNRATCLLTYY